MKRKVSIILISILAFIGLSSCTPEQMQVWNSLRPVQQQQVISALNPAGSHRELGKAMAMEAGYSEKEFNCLDNVINRESAWFIVANKGGSSAFGIPQALAMHSETTTAIWRSSPTLQIEWLFNYSLSRYGSFCKAWNFKRSSGWY